MAPASAATIGSGIGGPIQCPYHLRPAEESRSLYRLVIAYLTEGDTWHTREAWEFINAEWRLISKRRAFS